MTAAIQYAVIAGELAPGSRVPDSDFSKIPDLIREAFLAVNRMAVEPGHLQYEIIRMDEFMALSEDPLFVLRSLFMLQSAFRFLSGNELGKGLELSLCLGLGPVEYARDHLRESDGTAFRTATQGLRKMKRHQRLSILTGKEHLDGEFALSCHFSDILTSEWSEEQAEAVFLSLSGKNQTEISQMLDISQPAVNRRLKAAHVQAIRKFIQRYEQLTPSHTVL